MSRRALTCTVLSLLCALALPAFGDRDGDRDRGRERERERPLARSRDRDREHEEREHRRREGERERREREHREREHREREEREHREHREHREREHHRPELEVIELHHIPADAFMHVLGQLGENERLGEMLEQIPLAVCEHSNTIVVIGPPEVHELFHRLAEGIDRPSEFHQRMEHLERERRGPRPGGPPCPSGFRGRPPMGPGRSGPCPRGGRGMGPGSGMGPGRWTGPGKGMGFGRPGPCPMGRPGMGPGRGKGPGRGFGPGRTGPCPPCPPGAGRGPGPRGACPPDGPCPDGPPRGRGWRSGRHEGPGGGPEAMLHGALADPAGEAMNRLLHPKGAEILRLSDKQFERLEDIRAEYRENVNNLRRRIRHALEDHRGPRERAAFVREVAPKIGGRMAELMGELKDRVGGVLDEQQRQKAERLVRGDGPPPWARAHPDRDRDEKSDEECDDDRDDRDDDEDDDEDDDDDDDDDGGRRGGRRHDRRR